MKDYSTGWTGRKGSGSMSAPARPVSSDYSVMTMYFRDQVTKKKPKTPKYIRNMRSMSFQSRTLDNYPMPHGREDAIRSASGHRDARRMKREGLSRTLMDSESMREHSKQMFDYVVNRVRQNETDSVHSVQPQSSSENKSRVRSLVSSVKPAWSNLSDSTRNNGPSREGSVLYNSRQSVLNAIRLRPHSEPASIFNHEKNKSKPGLNEAINEKNMNYTVRPNLSSVYSRTGSVAGSAITGSICSSTDYVLVPLDDTFKDIDRRFSLDISDLNDSLETERDTFDDEAELSSVFKTSPNRRENHMLPPSASHGMRLVSLDEESSSESDDETVNVPQQPKKSDSVASRKMADKGQKFKGQKVAEQEPEVKPVKIQLKGPHCWVDDATVTSDISEQSADQINAGDEQKPEVEKKAFVKRLSQQKLNTETIETENKPNIDNAMTDYVLNVEENIENDFPPFLCPSSEKKSREAAIKDWLAHTCFRSGNRGVPML